MQAMMKKNEEMPLKEIKSEETPVKETYTCVVCPKGCRVTVEKKGNDYKVTGNKCPRGKTYAVTELTDPRRVLTSTVKVENGMEPVTSVKTTDAIPKGEIFDVMTKINDLKVKSPCKAGDVLIENVKDTGVDVVVTRDC